MDKWCTLMNENESDTEKFGSCTNTCDHKVECAETCYKKAFANVEHLRDFFAERKAQYDEYVQKCSDATAEHAAKLEECARKTNAWEEQRAHCNEKQAVAELKACEYTDVYRVHCMTYEGCRHSAEKAFHELDTEVKAKAADRDKEHKATQKVACVLGVWKKGGEVDAKRLAACDKYEAQSPLKLKERTLPEAEACKPAPLPDYNVLYKELPEGAPA